MTNENYNKMQMRDKLCFRRKAALQNAVEAMTNFHTICERFCEGENVLDEMMEAYKIKNLKSRELKEVENKIAEYRAKIKG